MPGFNVGGVGSGPSSKIEFYHSYTWRLPMILGDSAAQNPSLIMLKDASAPSFTASSERHIGGSLEYKYAKHITWDDVKISFYDSVGLIDILRKWRKSVWTESAGLRPAAEYKKNTELECFLPNNRMTFGWTLYNSWPSQIRSGELTYTNSEIKLAEVTLTYDWAEEKPV